MKEKIKKQKQKHIKAELEIWKPRFYNTYSKDKLYNFVMALIAYPCISAFQMKGLFYS